MKASKKCIDLIKKYEGFSSNPYLCSASVPTIGFGSTYYLDGRKVTLKDNKISLLEAESLLINSLTQTYEKSVLKLVKTALNQNQFDALVSFVYNLGENSLKKSTLLKKVNANPSDPTIKDEFMKWVFAGGKKLSGLENRRREETELYFS